MLILFYYSSPVAKLNNLGPDDNAELYGGQYQGDMVIEHGEERELESGRGRTGLIALRYKWAGGIVPYTVSNHHFSKYYQKV